MAKKEEKYVELPDHTLTLRSLLAFGMSSHTESSCEDLKFLLRSDLFALSEGSEITLWNFRCGIFICDSHGPHDFWHL